MLVFFVHLGPATQIPEKPLSGNPQVPSMLDKWSRAVHATCFLEK
jgi:hypothetical protein